VRGRWQLDRQGKRPGWSFAQTFLCGTYQFAGAAVDGLVLGDAVAFGVVGEAFRVRFERLFRLVSAFFPLPVGLLSPVDILAITHVLVAERGFVVELDDFTPLNTVRAVEKSTENVEHNSLFQFR
jgi:hypothetical protein